MCTNRAADGTRSQQVAGARVAASDCVVSQLLLHGPVHVLQPDQTRNVHVLQPYQTRTVQVLQPQHTCTCLLRSGSAVALDDITQRSLRSTAGLPMHKLSTTLMIQCNVLTLKLLLHTVAGALMPSPKHVMKQFSLQLASD